MVFQHSATPSPLITLQLLFKILSITNLIAYYISQALLLDLMA